MGYAFHHKVVNSIKHTCPMSEEWRDRNIL